MSLPCGAQAFSVCGAQASHCGGFSLCYRARAPGAQSLLVAAHRLTSCGTRALVAPWHVESPLTRN